MKFYLMMFISLYVLSANSDLNIPVGEYEYSGHQLALSQHRILLYNTSSVDMERLRRLKQKGYLCRRFPRQHLCKKSFSESSVEIELKIPFLNLYFDADYTVNELVTGASVDQYEVRQSVFYDGVSSEKPYYKAYVNEDDTTYLDPTLSRLVRLEWIDESRISQLHIINKRVSAKETYRLYFTLFYDAE